MRNTDNNTNTKTTKTKKRRKTYRRSVLAATDWAVGFLKDHNQYELADDMIFLRSLLQNSRLTRPALTSLKLNLISNPLWDRNNLGADKLKSAIDERNKRWRTQYKISDEDMSSSDISVYKAIYKKLPHEFAATAALLLTRLVKGPTKLLTKYFLYGRIKTPESLFGKMNRPSNRGLPWTHWKFHDILGIRTEWYSTADFIEFVNWVDAELQDIIVYRRDYIGRTSYNGINYVFAIDSNIIEMQTLPYLSAIGSKLNHLLTYRREKSISSCDLSDDELWWLVRRVVNGAYYLTYRSTYGHNETSTQEE